MCSQCVWKCLQCVWKVFAMCQKSVCMCLKIAKHIWRQFSPRQSFLFLTFENIAGTHFNASTLMYLDLTMARGGSPMFSSRNDNYNNMITLFQLHIYIVYVSNYIKMNQRFYNIILVKSLHHSSRCQLPIADAKVHPQHASSWHWHIATVPSQHIPTSHQPPKKSTPWHQQRRLPPLSPMHHSPWSYSHENTSHHRHYQHSLLNQRIISEPTGADIDWSVEVSGQKTMPSNWKPTIWCAVAAGSGGGSHGGVVLFGGGGKLEYFFGCVRICVWQQTHANTFPTHCKHCKHFSNTFQTLSRTHCKHIGKIVLVGWSFGLAQSSLSTDESFWVEPNRWSFLFGKDIALYSRSLKGY